MAPGRSRVRVSVRLESDDPACRFFLDDREVELQDGLVLPLEYEGHLYDFVRRTPVGDYSGSTAESFIFRDTGPAR